MYLIVLGYLSDLRIIRIVICNLRFATSLSSRRSSISRQKFDAWNRISFETTKPGNQESRKRFSTSIKEFPLIFKSYLSCLLVCYGSRHRIGLSHDLAGTCVGLGSSGPRGPSHLLLRVRLLATLQLHRILGPNSARHRTGLGKLNIAYLWTPMIAMAL